MNYRVCKLVNGAVSTTTTIPDDIETASEYAAKHGGEVVSAELVVALSRGDAPPVGVSSLTFRKRLIPLRVALTMHPDASVKAKWAAVLPELDYFTIVYPDQSPVSDLITMAVADGLITSEQAVAIVAPE